jgi:hypothetical protein
MRCTASARSVHAPLAQLPIQVNDLLAAYTHRERKRDDCTGARAAEQIELLMCGRLEVLLAFGDEGGCRQPQKSTAIQAQDAQRVTTSCR